MGDRVGKKIGDPYTSSMIAEWIGHTERVA